MHFNLDDGFSKELEAYPETNMQMKVKLRDRTLPLTLTFVYMDDRRKDLSVFYSQEHKLPRENLNHGHSHNVSLCSIPSFCSPKKYRSRLTRTVSPLSP